MKLTSILLPGVLLGGAAMLLAPAPDTYGFALLGFSLGASGQRDWRVLNDFSDPQANNNTTVDDVNWPGWDGAELALWKAASEWASVLHGGTGAGDPVQNVGNGGANFDFVFAGAATSEGTSTQNIVSSIGACSSGVFAYVESPASNGWRMQVCDNEWVWSDGPGNPGGSTVDLQAIATHEFGHSLGLGHSGVGSATMFATATGGTGPRSIAGDDQSGVQAIYGVMSGSKCEITNANVDLGSNEVTITGQNFSTTGNEVWFTNADATSGGAEPKVIVSGVSSTGGGTQIVVSIPANANSGDVHVKNANSGHDSLSNGWPVNFSMSSGDPLTVTGITPNSFDALVPGTAETVTVTGTGFTVDVELTIGLFQIIPEENYTIVDPETITINMPEVPVLGLQTLTVDNGTENDSIDFTIVANSSPTIEMGNGDPLNTVSGTLDTVAAGGIGQLHYVLYSGSNAPSVRGIVALDIGGFFTDLYLLDTYTIGGGGTTAKSFPLPVTTADFYMQSITLAQGFPIPTSNVQSIHIVP